MAIVEYNIPINKRGSLQSAMQYKYFTESFTNQTKKQKQGMLSRRSNVNHYIKETGDRNLISIATKLGISIYTLKRDVYAMKKHIKGGEVID